VSQLALSPVSSVIVFVPAPVSPVGLTVIAIRALNLLG
jgi:hypothetical protein